jgi:hypothetical protein
MKKVFISRSSNSKDSRFHFTHEQLERIDCQLLAVVLTNFNDHQSVLFTMKVVGLILFVTHE